MTGEILTLDFETYYDDEYSLKKLTTEAYVRDPRFEPLILSWRLGEDQPQSTSGDDIPYMLDAFEIETRPVLCHHAHFDGLILSHHYGKRPKIWFDTLSMSRPIHGIQVGGSLAKLRAHYGLAPKGTAINDAKGKHLRDFTREELHEYKRYSEEDSWGTYEIFKLLLKENGGYPQNELRQIDWVIRMFTEPQVYLDQELLEEYLKELRAQKTRLLLEGQVQLDQVMSAEQFAQVLRDLGVDPPRKISPRTGKPTYAFAKSDWQMEQLAEHDDPRVQAVIAARLGNKSTMAESRTERMIDMAPRGAAPLYYNYCGAEQTNRLSGGDSMNWQNLHRGGVLRDAIYCDDDHVFVVVDSTNIEARFDDWLAGQDDMLEVYRRYDRGEGPDVYCVMATKLYGKEITPSDNQERQLGKVVKLACGYQMGRDRLIVTARGYGVRMTPPQGDEVIRIYRTTHSEVVRLWSRAQNALPWMKKDTQGREAIDKHGLVRIYKESLLLPNGLFLKYPQLTFKPETNEWSYKGRKGFTNIYGGKIIENVIQALARVAIMEQTVKINKHFRVVMHSHDELVMLVPKDQAAAAYQFAVTVMSQSPSWAPGVPLAAKGAWGRRYGECK